MKWLHTYRQTITMIAGSEIAAGGTKTITVQLPTNGGQLRRIALERTAGDCVSFDWKLLSYDGADAALKTLYTLDSAAGIVPGAGLDDDNAHADGAKTFVVVGTARRLTLTVTANGGTGGNLFTVYVQCDMGDGSGDDVSLAT